MSDVVARMRLESQDFDNKLKSATANLQHMEREVRRTGATFEYADKEELEFLQSLGQMETKALDAKGKIKELSNSYKELAMMYGRMTDAEKASEPGKALANSLQQIKTRLNDTKQSFEKVQNQIGEGGGGLGKVMETLGSKIGIPAGAFTALGGAMAAGAAAAKVAKDAFLATEGGIDTWGRTVEGAKGAYSVFLDTLNNGNWGSFFTNLKNAISGASDLYDAMDRLGSIKANNQAAIAKEQATIQELRLRQQKGENVAAELRAAEERLRKLQNESVEQGKVAGREQMRQAIANSANSMGNGGLFRRDKTAKVAETDIDAAIEDILANGQAAMDKYAEQYSQLSQKALKTTTQINYSPGGVAYETTKTEFDWSALTTEEQQMYKLAKAITDTESTLQQGISTFAQATSEGASSAREAFQTERFAQRGDRATAAAAKAEEKAPEGSAAALKKQIADLQEAWNKASTQDERNSIKGQIDAANEALKAMTPQIEPVAAAIKDAAAMWTEHSQKIADVKARLEEFKAMATDTSLTDSQREWAQGMADAYQKQLDKMTGATEEAANNMADSLDKVPTKFELMRESLDKMSTGVSAISTLGNSLNDLKGIGEDLASAFSGEMDAWDSLMTVFNSGIGILETVMGVMEAINTLQELGNALSDAKVAKQAAETTAVVSGKGAEAAAETAEAAASGTATAANTAEAASGAGKAMAGIPIVGPVLAIAAIAAVLAAVLAATSKAKSAGKFASGGLIGGSSFSGDNLTANVNSGELILNRAQQASIAGQLSGGATQTVVVEGRISGKDILLSANNTNRAAGGSRGYYTQVK